MKKLLTTSIALTALVWGMPAFAQEESAGDNSLEPIEFEEPAPQDPPAPDAVAYVVNGEEFTFAYMMQFAGLLIPNLEQYDIELNYPIMSNLAVEQVLAAEKARELGLDMTPQLQADLQLIVNSVLSNAYLEQRVAERLTPEAVQAAYDDYLTSFVSETQATAS